MIFILTKENALKETRGAVLAIIPVVILFLIFQKYMMTGYSKAAMK